MNIKLSNKKIYVYILVFLLTFQNAIEIYIPLISLIDELIAFVGILCILFCNKDYSTLRIKKQVVIAMIALLAFVFSGVLSNLIFSYQNIKLVLIDLFTNIKFFLSILCGYFIYKKSILSNKYYTSCARFFSGVIFVVFILDRIFHLFPSSIRYGIKDSTLFFYHSTYLAGAMVFLIAVLTIFYIPKNRIYILFDLIVLLFTLRGKAIAATAVYFILIWIRFIGKKKIKVWNILLVAVAAVVISWPQISFYFFKLSGESARSVLLITSFKILKDYFPLGTGFATYASHTASVIYSPVYIKYGFLNVWDLNPNNPMAFFDDSFWPIIIGQTGVIGTVGYIICQATLIRGCLLLTKSNKYMNVGVVFIICYLFISSIAEPAFNNSVAIPLGYVIGIILKSSTNHMKEELN